MKLNEFVIFLIGVTSIKSGYSANIERQSRSSLKHRIYIEEENVSSSFPRHTGFLQPPLSKNGNKFLNHILRKHIFTLIRK